jgi:hypothetical protein
MLITECLRAAAHKTLRAVGGECLRHRSGPSRGELGIDPSKYLARVRVRRSRLISI